MLNHLEHQPQATSNSPHVRVRHAAVLGGGAWGTALAQMLARGGSQVVLQAMEKEVVDAVNTVHENTTFLKGAKLSPDVRAVQSVKEAVEGAEVVLLVVPTPFIRSFAVKNRDVLPVGVPLVCCSKGIEQNTLLTPFEILEDELPGKYHPHIAVLSGPSFAREVAENRPTCVAVASKRPELTSFLQQSISSKNFRIYMSNDPMGLELCGALKNVYAVVSGAVDEMNLGLNTRAAIITRGLAELAQLAVIKGASPLTVAGLGGVGDLVLTCTGSLSRNWQVGSRLAKGERMEEIIKSMKQVAEGVHTAKAIHQLAERYHVDMPIAEMIYKVLYEGMELRPALEALFESEPHIAELSFESLEKVKEEHNSKRKQSLAGGGGSGVSNRGSVPTTPSRLSQSEHIILQ